MLYTSRLYTLERAEDLPDDTTIVTGLPGWLGNRFVDALLNGLPEVASLTQPRPRQLRVLSTDSEHPFMKQIGRSENVGIVAGDLRNKSDVQRLFEGCNGGTVFHIAGVIHPANARDFFSINYEGTKNMLDQALKSGVKRFIYVSSNSPLGVNASNDALFDESAPYNPYMNYGKSKMMAEQLVTSADSSLETVIIRPPWFYGPGQPPRQSLFFTMIKNGKAPIVGDGKNLRSMAYVDNISQGLLLAEKVEKANKQIYWIADARPYSMNEIVDTIEKVLENDFSMKVTHKRMRLPGIAAEVALAVDASLQSLGLYQQKIHVLSEMNKTIACSIQKARTELGYDPKIALEEGMRRSIAWVLKEGITI
jgi:nucleoside-diphosphate-sugar epimerase